MFLWRLFSGPTLFFYSLINFRLQWIQFTSLVTSVIRLLKSQPATSATLWSRCVVSNVGGMAQLY